MRLPGWLKAALWLLALVLGMVAILLLLAATQPAAAQDLPDDAPAATWHTETWPEGVWWPFCGLDGLAFSSFAGALRDQTPLWWDYDGNGVIDGLDFSAFASRFGAPCAQVWVYWPPGFPISALSAQIETEREGMARRIEGTLTVNGLHVIVGAVGKRVRVRLIEDGVPRDWEEATFSTRWLR